MDDRDGEVDDRDGEVDDRDGEVEENGWFERVFPFQVAWCKAYSNPLTFTPCIASVLKNFVANRDFCIFMALLLLRHYCLALGTEFHLKSHIVCP